MLPVLRTRTVPPTMFACCTLHVASGQTVAYGGPTGDHTLVQAHAAEQAAEGSHAGEERERGVRPLTHTLVGVAAAAAHLAAPPALLNKEEAPSTTWAARGPSSCGAVRACARGRATVHRGAILATEARSLPVSKKCGLLIKRQRSELQLRLTLRAQLHHSSFAANE